MTEQFALGVDGTIVNLRHVQRIKAEMFGDKWSVIASIEPGIMWTVLAGPFDTKDEAIEEMGWLASQLGAKFLWR